MLFFAYGLFKEMLYYGIVDNRFYSFMHEEKQDNPGEAIKCSYNKKSVRVFAHNLSQPDCNTYSYNKKEHKESENGNCP